MANYVMRMRKANPQKSTNADAAAARAPLQRRRKAEAQDDFRQEILRVARRLFRAGGLDALTIRAITEPLGVSKMAFYGYFPDKESLLRHLWVDVLGEQFAELLMVGEGRASSLDVLRAHMDAYLHYWEARPDDYRSFMTLAPTPDGANLPGLPAEPAYRQLLALHRERVLACAGDRRWSAVTVDRLAALAHLKAIGYLQLALGVSRFPLGDRGTLRAWTLDDIVESMRNQPSEPPP